MNPAEDLTNVLLDGRYRLTRLMGEGGMGQVYEGIHEALDRKVAVKVLLPRYAYDTKFRERFLREAKAASKVRHPNVVQILDFGDTPGGSVYFSMELLEGRDLAALLRAEGPLPWPRARHILLQAMSALAAAHERKIIHRDIKPANFFIEEGTGLQDFVKVLDFGIAKLAVDASNEESSLAQSLTGTGEVFGTAKYMAPEQAYGASNDPRVDVYSLGIVAYELLTGQVPFTGVSAFHIITRHVNDPPRPPRELVPTIPPEVEAWILRALAKRPEERFGSMVEMEQALLAIKAGVPAAAPMIHSRPPPSAVPPPVQSAGPAAPGPAPAVARATLPAVPEPVVRAVRTTLPAMPPPAPAPAVVQAPSPVQARPRALSDVVTAPSLARPARAATSVIPTRLKAPSSVTSGELVGSDPVERAASTSAVAVPSSSESSGLGSATARMQGAGDGASGTGPMGSYTAGTVVPETDPHPVYTASRPVVPSRRSGAVLGLLGTLGGGLAVLIGYLVVTASEPEPAPSAPVVEASTPKAEVDVPPSDGAGATVESGSPSTTPGASEAAVAGEATVAPATTAPSVPVPAEPTPAGAQTSAEAQTPAASSPSVAAEPAMNPAAPSATPKPMTKPTKPAAPPTDDKVVAALGRTLKKKCGVLADGVTVTVRLLVDSAGRVISKDVEGATGELKKCLASETAKAQFRAGERRPLKATVSF